MRIPCNYEPRLYQLPFLQAMELGKRRACLVWHRRSGKSKTLLNFAMRSAFERVGTYYHAFPEYGQGRKILWDGIDRDGHPVMEWHCPKELRLASNSQEMKVTLRNGSVWQIIGADNYDSLVGPNPVGIILDEWAVSDKYPKAWDYFRPILAENGGWAVFPFTPRGRNHGFELYQNALANPDWFCEVLTVKDTGSITLEAIDAERRAGMSDMMIQQEFYSSFIAPTENIVIPYELIQAALDRDLYYSKSPRIAGLDVARFGDDRTVLFVRQGGGISYVETWNKTDANETVGRVRDRFRSGLFDTIAVDDIGMGGPVGDLLKANGLPVTRVLVNEKARDDGRFHSLRDELWWALREWFEEGECCIPKSLMGQTRQSIIKDIQDIRYGYSATQRIKVESKDDMKKRLGFSPDIGDAFCMTFANKVNLKVGRVIASRHQAGAENWDRRGGGKTWDGKYQEWTV